MQKRVAKMARQCVLVVVLLCVVSSTAGIVSSQDAAAKLNSHSSTDSQQYGQLLNSKSDYLTSLYDSNSPEFGSEHGIQPSLSERTHTVHSEAPQISPSVDILTSAGIVLGYSRYEDSDPLENSKRAQIYDLVVSSPGTYITEVSKITEVHRSTVRYHVRILEGEGLIASHYFQGKHRLYSVEQTDVAVLAALDNKATAVVLESMLTSEPVTVSVLADDVDKAASTISYHLTRLQEDDLVIVDRSGNSTVARLSEDVRRVLRSERTTARSANAGDGRVES